MLKLYGGARSRAAIVQWYLEEIGAPYEFVQLDMQAGEHLQPDYLAINPMGKVPAIDDEGVKLWESGAILLYLAKKYGKMPEALENKAELSQWVIFANATLLPNIFNEAARAKEMPQLLKPLNAILSRQPFIAGEEFTIADVAMGAALAYIGMMLKVDFSQEYPQVAEYTKRLSQRPAFIKVMGGRG